MSSGMLLGRHLEDPVRRRRRTLSAERRSSDGVVARLHLAANMAGIAAHGSFLGEHSIVVVKFRG